MSRSRRPLRDRDCAELDALSDDELAEVAHFGNLVDDGRTVIFRASAEQRVEAGALLRQREAS
jgi:hypothetical protein